MSIRRLQSRATPKRITRECELAPTSIKIGRESLLVIREQKLEGAGFADRRWRDFEVEDGAKVIRGYNRGLGGSKRDIGKFSADGDHEGRREVA